MLYICGRNKNSCFMIDKYINPHTDFGFKRLFGSEFYERELKLYEDSMNAYRDIVNAIRTAEKTKFAEGRAEGIAEGRAEGIAEVAKKMLDKGMSAEVVADMTGLSLDEVFKLKQ